MTIMNQVGTQPFHCFPMLLNQVNQVNSILLNQDISTELIRHLSGKQLTDLIYFH